MTSPSMNAAETLRRVLYAHAAALVFLPAEPLPRLVALGLVAGHAAALTLAARIIGIPVILPLGALFCIAVLQFSKNARVWASPTFLAPFGFLYAVIGVRWVWINLFAASIPGYYDYAPVDWRVPLLNPASAFAAAVAYSAVIVFSRGLRDRSKTARALTLVVVIVSLGWCALEFLGHRTAGSTASDPYAYVQMAIDLVERASPAHRFEAFPLIAKTHLSWYPILHVGYRLPFNELGDAVSVWSPGGSAAFALAYQLLGEEGLYLVNPLFSILGVVMSGLLAWELSRKCTSSVRSLCAAGALAITASSNELVNWASVTMVDSQALVFTTLAVYLALIARRRGDWLTGLGAGASLGMAYQVRHTQVLVAFSVALLLITGSQELRQRLVQLVAAAAAALAVALPDLWYHLNYLGHWLIPESEELSLFALGAIPETAVRLANSAFVGVEFGWLVVFGLVGIVLYTRSAPVESAALLLWVGSLVILHMPYSAVRLRDLLAELPAVAFWASYGVVAPVSILAQSQSVRRWAVAGLVIFSALDLLALRVWNTAPRPLFAARPIFGGMTHTQRGAFSELGRITPENSIIGASLNSGAIDLYARRSAFRPADWSAVELDEFLEIAEGAGRRVFILEDNAAVSAIVERLSGRVEPVRVLDVPMYGEGTVRTPGMLWRVLAP